jgi:hypothetical protein
MACDPGPTGATRTMTARAGAADAVTATGDVIITRRGRAAAGDADGRERSDLQEFAP